jgi:hypothetical protein
MGLELYVLESFRELPGRLSRDTTPRTVSAAWTTLPTGEDVSPPWVS